MSSERIRLLAELRAPLDPQRIRRNPRGKSYMAGWFIERELSRVFGEDGWDVEVRDLTITAPYEVQGDKGVRMMVGAHCSARLTVRAQPGWAGVVRDGVGAGSGMSYQGDLADCIKQATKEAATDALKRAAKTLGNPFGLSLYDKDNPVHNGGEDWWAQRPPEDPEAATEQPGEQAQPDGAAVADRLRKLWFARLSALCKEHRLPDVSRDRPRRSWLLQEVLGLSSLTAGSAEDLEHRYAWLRDGCDDDYLVGRLKAAYATDEEAAA